MTLVAVEPLAPATVSLADIKSDLRIDHTDDDARLTRHATAATQWVERITGQSLVSQQWEWTVEASEIDGASLWLPLRPVISVDEISFDATVYDETDYMVARLGSNQGSYIEFVGTTNTWTAGSVILFTAGYDPVSEPLCHAIIRAVKVLYDDGDLNSDGTLLALISPHRLMWV